MGSPTVIVRACIISLSQTSGCVGWVAHRLLVSCSVLGVAVKPVLLTYLLTPTDDTLSITFRCGGRGLPSLRRASRVGCGRTSNGIVATAPSRLERRERRRAAAVLPPSVAKEMRGQACARGARVGVERRLGGNGTEHCMG